MLRTWRAVQNVVPREVYITYMHMGIRLWLHANICVRQQSPCLIFPWTRAVTVSVGSIGVYVKKYHSKHTYIHEIVIEPYKHARTHQRIDLLRRCLKLGRDGLADLVEVLNVRDVLMDSSARYVLACECT